MKSTCGKKNEIIKEDYYLKQIYTLCLSQYSYYIESENEAIIIDPLRESDIYDQILLERGAKLIYILETHFHADFISGHYELAHKYNASIIYGPNAKAEITIKVAEDEELIKVGNINIKVIHTPGHTLESSSYLLINSKGIEECIFTGDTLFMGEVGRPDLAVKEGVTEADLAVMLYDSIQRLSNLNDNIIVYPGHGAGSACGKNISAGDYDTMGNQKKTNYAFNQHLTKEEFTEIVTSNLSTPPQYFFFDVMMNKKGYQYTNDILEKSYKPIDFENFKIYLQDSSIVVLDTRDIEDSSKGFIPGSILNSLKNLYAIWTAILYKPETKFIIVAESGRERDSIIRLARVGMENCLGYLEGGFDTWIKNGETADSYKFVDLLDKEEANKYTVFDVREKKEWDKTGIIPGSLTISLSKLNSRLDEVPRDKNLVTMCLTGQRSALTISILKKLGFKNILANAKGGLQYLLDNKYDNLIKP